MTNRDRLITKRGYDFYVATSAMQKAIRRGETALAGFFALELMESGFHNYVWKRLMTISAEDCHGIITQEIESLWNGFKEHFQKGTQKGRIYLAKAIIVLSQAPKSRDADHLTNLIYDKEVVTSEAERFMNSLDKTEKMAVPDYVYDVHTIQGKKRGKTKEDFFREEFKALNPRQKGLFDTFVDNKGGE